jgi:hypothetical protein
MKIFSKLMIMMRSKNKLLLRMIMRVLFEILMHRPDHHYKHCSPIPGLVVAKHSRCNNVLGFSVDIEQVG